MIPSWAQEDFISNRSFRFADIVGPDDIVVGKTFEDCSIYGPSVIVPLDDNTFEHSSFEGDPDALIWEIPEERERIIGAIGVSRCTFRRCFFRKIGVAGKKEFTDALRQDLLRSSGLGQPAEEQGKKS